MTSKFQCRIDKDDTTVINELWRTDVTRLKTSGSGRYCLSIILDDFSRNIVSVKCSATMCARDVTETLAHI